MATAEKKTITGGCHCGLIRYTVAATPNPETGKFTGTRCNCTFCRSFSTTNIQIKDPADFTLLSPKDKSEMGNYAPRIKTLNRWFCKICGTHVYIDGQMEYGGHKIPLFAVNLASVEQPQENIDLSEVKVKYFDMLNENIAGGLKETPWPHGLV